MTQLGECVWAEDGKSVEISGQRFDVVLSKLAGLDAFRAEFLTASWVFQRAHLADTSFQTGDAEYRDLVRRLRDLSAGLQEAARDLRAASAAIEDFFHPPKILAMFGEDSELAGGFVKEAVERLEVLAASAAIESEAPAEPPAGDAR